jgi:hypothetical protein
MMHNVVWGNTGGSMNYESGELDVRYCDIEGGFDGVGVIDEDPVFVDANAGNYNLEWNSPCIDAGDPDEPYDTDNTPADLGAHPYYHTGTEVSGEVWGVWERRNHPYYINADMSVPTDSSLAIEAGTIVYSEGYFVLTVDSAASLHAIGTDQKPIVFTCTDTATGWLGLQIYFADSTSILEQCVIEHVKTDGHAYYAALYLDNASPVVRHCTIRNNKQNQITGGGIRCVDESSPLIENCLIANNRSAQGGAGIFIGSESSPRIVGCSITGNKSLGSTATGGGILCESSSALISGCIIDSNYGHNTGGGIYAVLSTVSVHRTVVVDNSGTYVGAIGGRGSRFEIINCSIAGHHHTTRTAAVYGYSNSDFQIMNSILWDNSPAQIYLRQSGATVPCSLSISYTDLEGGVAAIDTMGENYIEEGLDVIDTDPLLADGYLCRLLIGSPCIDAGNPGAECYDFEDPVRPGSALWPALGGLRNDMGAYGGTGEDTPVDVISDDQPLLPAGYSLGQNYPNPFNPTTTIEFSLPRRSEVVISVYNILGRKVLTLLDEELPAGYHRLVWNGKSGRGQDVATGLYFYRIKAGDFVQTKKMLLLK